MPIPVRLQPALLASLEAWILAAGVEFTNGDQPGLRLTRTAAARPEEPGDRSKTKVGAKIAGLPKNIELIRVTLV